MSVTHSQIPSVFEGFELNKVDYEDSAIEFYHMCAVTTGGKTVAMHNVGSMSGFNPIIIGMRSPAHKPYKMYNNLIAISSSQKSEQPWQRQMEEMLQIVDSFSKPGDVVMDSFMGVGVNGILAKLTTRKFIGVEINKNVFEDAKRLIAQASG